VRVEFGEEYGVVPVVTLTPIGLPVMFYLDNVTTSGFDIVISEEQAEEVVFNWHAFAGQSDEKKEEKEKREEVDENVTESNETVEENVTIPEVNVSIPVNESEINQTIPEVNISVPENESEVNATIPEINVSIPENETENQTIEIVSPIRDDPAGPDENSSEDDGLISITGAAVGVNNQDGLFSRFVKFIGDLFEDG
jgi:hypothetical protein